MNWEAIGAIGEILGAAAVVATLLYLAKQTRVNANAAVSASRGASAIAISEVDREIARDPELARIAHKSFQEELADYDEIEWLRFTTFARSLIGLYEDQFMQALDGTTDPKMAEIHVAAVIAFIEHPAWKQFWDLETRGDTWRKSSLTLSIPVALQPRLVDR